MIQDLLELKEESLQMILNIDDLKDLNEARLLYLGKKGKLTVLLRGLGTLNSNDRRELGIVANKIRNELENKIEDIKQSLKQKELARRLKSEAIDVTLPSKRIKRGAKHPITMVLDDIQDIFLGICFSIEEGPEVELEYYNFSALNMPMDHPARDEQDTFYTEGGFILRTATSPIQVRAMEKSDLPLRIIAPGRVFRSDEVDATHSPIFHQLEGLVVDENITMMHLKSTLTYFASQLFGSDIKTRFRPHYFPFTEPSAEMDISCFSCNGVGCRVCKSSGFIEILGCGMVHPNVLSMSGVDASKYSGFAFGLGIERIAMQRYNISDMRMLFENDTNFLNQF